MGNNRKQHGVLKIMNGENYKECQITTLFAMQALFQV